jgi:hypothetical protein
MPWTKTQKMIAWGTVVLMALVVVTLFLCRHRIAAHLVIADGERAIAKQIVTPVDMTARYMVPAYQFDSLQTLGWRSVPIGFQVYVHVPFNVDGMICLWGGRSAKGGLTLPDADTDIAVNQKFQTLYVYHAAFFASPHNTPVYDLVFNYADGSSVTNQVLYGADVLDWNVKRSRNAKGPTGARSKVGWQGGTFTPGKNDPLRFTVTAIDNPQPVTEVATIDLISCKSESAPCILAMTAGKSGLMK